MPEGIKLFDCEMDRDKSTRISEQTCVARIRDKNKRWGQGSHRIDPGDYKCDDCAKGKKIQGSK